MQPWKARSGEQCRLTAVPESQPLLYNASRDIPKRLVYSSLLPSAMDRDPNEKRRAASLSNCKVYEMYSLFTSLFLTVSAMKLLLVSTFRDRFSHGRSPIVQAIRTSLVSFMMAVTLEATNSKVAIF